MNALNRTSARCVLFLMLFLVASPVRAQVCSGNRNLNSQAQVNLFDCAVVTGTLNINGFDITDLTPLSELTSVGTAITDQLTISSNDMLASLAGLENLTSVSGTFHIRHNPVLASLSGLSGLTSVDSLLSIEDNVGLVSLTGLEGFSQAASISIIFNDALASLSALSGLTSVTGLLQIANNPAIESLMGLESLTSVGSHLFIQTNEELESLTGLETLVTVGGRFNITQNTLLESLAGLDGLTSVGGPLVIAQNPILSSLDGLETLTAIDQSLDISQNPVLMSLQGLEGLASVAEFVTIYQNTLLESLDGLGALSAVGVNLIVTENDALNDCACGLAGLISGMPPAFTGVGGVVDIDDNLLNGQCSSPFVVLMATCDPVANEPVVHAPDGFALSAVWPNPLRNAGHFTLDVNDAQRVRVVVHDVLGRPIRTLHDGTVAAGALSLRLDAATWPSGVYVVRAEGPAFSATRSLVVVH
jgi:hypothetical protein